MSRRIPVAVVAAAVLAAVLGAPALATPAPLGDRPVHDRTQGELVRNGGFEEGLTGWTVDSHATAVSLGRSDRTGARIVAPRPGLTAIKDRPNSARYTADGATYRASAWVLAEQPGATVRLTVREVEQRFVTGSDARVLVRSHQATTVLPDRLWHQVALDFSVGEGHQLDVAVLAYITAAGTGLILDDISLVQQGGDAGAPIVPPPPSLTPNTGKSCEITGFTAYAEPGESSSDALARRDRDLGRAPVLRVFHPGLPEPWPGRAGSADRDVVVSFKADPGRILSGALDTQLSDWFATAPTSDRVYWSYYHEPEDQIESGTFTAEQYRAAWRHLAELADAAGPPNLQATLILMAWSVNPRSGRTWTDYYPGDDVVDVLGWDAYNLAARADVPRYEAPQQVFGPAAQVSIEAGKPFGFAEWGSLLLPGDDGTGRAAWIISATQEQASLGAVFSTYFDAPVGADYRLTDRPSQSALRSAIAC